MATSARSVRASHQRQDMPQPDDDESQSEFIDRCVEELTGDGLDEDQASEACQLAWEDRAPAKGAIQHKTHSGDVQGMEFVLSDESIDRMGDIISAAGWQLADFAKNPIALFGHNSSFPIGNWNNLRVEGGALRGYLQLAPEGTSARIDEIRRLVDAGILKSVSVGFRDIEHQPRKDADGNWIGLHFTKQELVECSLVSVPANPNALAVAKSLNISSQTLDLVFAKHGKKDAIVRRGLTGKHADTSRKSGRGRAMSSLAQRITALQQELVQERDALQTHLDTIDDSNVSDEQLQKISDLNATIAQCEKRLAVLTASEKVLGGTIDNGTGRALVVRQEDNEAEDDAAGRARALRQRQRPAKKDELRAIDYYVRSAVVAFFAKTTGRPLDDMRQKIYGDDEPTRQACDLVLRAASAPAMTTVTGWAAELVQQTYADPMGLLMPNAILPRLSALGMTLNFGRAGRIIIPTRARTPTIAGSFVGEGQPIPVRQGAFTSQTLTPKKVGVITSWTREMNDHSIPAIEGLLKEAVMLDTSVAIDSVLIDANPATLIRPAGLLNSVAAIPATAGGGLAAVIGDISALTAALTASTYGNLRQPAWLMNPSDVLRISFAYAANTGIFPFRDEIRQDGTLNGVAIIDSATVPPKTMVLVDAADFVVVGGEAPRLEISDQATLHMEDTAPLELASEGSPGTIAAPQRSLFQTDSLALRMVMPLNWIQRRAGTIAWTQNVTW